MKEYICKDVPTEVGGYLDIETELVRCKDCLYYVMSGNGVNGFCRHMIVALDSYNWCSKAEPKEEAG
jgi:hypothetical protein